jgi:hypothetical protein
MLIMLAIIVALAVLAPVFGADTRDGLNWTPNHFWLSRRTGGRRRVRNPGSRGREDGGRAAEGARRTIPAAG